MFRGLAWVLLTAMHDLAIPKSMPGPSFLHGFRSTAASCAGRQYYVDMTPWQIDHLEEICCASDVTDQRSAIPGSLKTASGKVKWVEEWRSPALGEIKFGIANPSLEATLRQAQQGPGDVARIAVEGTGVRSTCQENALAPHLAPVR